MPLNPIINKNGSNKASQFTIQSQERVQLTRQIVRSSSQLCITLRELLRKKINQYRIINYKSVINKCHMTNIRNF